MEVEAWAAPGGLSAHLVKPERPPPWRRVGEGSSSRENLVGIGLVTDIPDEAVPRRVEHVVKRDGKLDHTETGT